MSDLNRPTNLRPACKTALGAARIGAVAVLWLALANTAVAQTLTGKFSVQEQLEYENNTLLSASNRQKIFGSVTSPTVTIEATTPTITSTLSGRADVRRFDESQFDSNDAHVGWNSRYDGERTDLGLNLKFDLDTVRTSELDSGVLVVDDARRRRWQVAPRGVIDLTALDQVEVGGGYVRNTYGSNRYTDYETWSIAPTFRHSFTPLDSGFVSLMADRYETLEGRKVQIDSVSPVAGWTHRWNELIQISGYLGWRFSFTDTSGAATERSNGLTASLDWSYRDEEDEFGLRASRAISPLSNGVEVQADTLSGRWQHRVNERLQTRMDAYYRHNEELDGAEANTSTYFEVSPRLIYELTDQWNLTPSYRYRAVVRPGENDNADSHAFFVNITFDLDPVELN